MQLENFYTSLANAPKGSLSDFAHKVLSSHPNREVRRAWASRADMPENMVIEHLRAEEETDIVWFLSRAAHSPEAFNILLERGMYLEALTVLDRYEHSREDDMKAVKAMTSGLGGSKGKRFFNDTLLSIFYGPYKSYSESLYRIGLELVDGSQFSKLVTTESVRDCLDVISSRIVSFGASMPGFSALWALALQADLKDLAEPHASKIRKVAQMVIEKEWKGKPVDNCLLLKEWFEGVDPKLSPQNRLLNFSATRAETRRKRELEEPIKLSPDASLDDVKALFSAYPSTPKTCEVFKSWLKDQADSSVDSADLIWILKTYYKVQLARDLHAGMVRVASDKPALFLYDKSLFLKPFFLDRRESHVGMDVIRDLPVADVLGHLSPSSVFELIESEGAGAVEVFDALAPTFGGTFNELLVALKEFSSH